MQLNSLCNKSDRINKISCDCLANSVLQRLPSRLMTILIRPWFHPKFPPLCVTKPPDCSYLITPKLFNGHAMSSQVENSTEIGNSFWRRIISRIYSNLLQPLAYLSSDNPNPQPRLDQLTTCAQKVNHTSTTSPSLVSAAAVSGLPHSVAVTPNND